MTILMHYLRIGEYLNRLELLLNTLKLWAVGSSPRWVFSLLFYFNIIYVSLILTRLSKQEIDQTYVKNWLGRVTFLYIFHIFWVETFILILWIVRWMLHCVSNQEFLVNIFYRNDIVDYLKMPYFWKRAFLTSKIKFRKVAITRFLYGKVCLNLKCVLNGIYLTYVVNFSVSFSAR
jgi:hypothetical protein